jgi:hypothetical protein
VVRSQDKKIARIRGCLDHGSRVRIETSIISNKSGPNPQNSRLSVKLVDPLSIVDLEQSPRLTCYHEVCQSGLAEWNLMDVFGRNVKPMEYVVQIHLLRKPMTIIFTLFMPIAICTLLGLFSFGSVSPVRTTFPSPSHHITSHHPTSHHHHH